MNKVSILGGGLAGGLVARALARRADVDLTVIEEQDMLGGNHVWSFFDRDVAEGDRWLIDGLTAHRWLVYDVAFPARRRTFDHPYNSITSEQFDRVLRQELGDRIVRGDANRLQPGGAVIDARGVGDLGMLDCGWQKFVGMSFWFDAPHGVTRPTVMDATVPQIDGYRFVYVLPFSETELFVEDTYYSDGPELDTEALKARLIDYVASRGWRGTPGNRIESGVLPVIMDGDFDAYWNSTGAGAKAGMRAGLCQPTTGYSLPDAVRLASAIGAASDLSPAGLERLTRDHARKAWRERGFYRMLDKMLFKAAKPHERYKVLQRFYGLSPALIGRFYASRSTLRDRMRILAGRPPVPIHRAIKAILS
jgi:lycopene beta-cyclase